MKVQIGNHIKEGINSNIFEGVFPLKIAIKRYKKEITNMIDFKKQKKILELLESKHVVHLYGVQDTANYSDFYLEYCDSTLRNYMKEEKCSINKIRKFFNQLNQAFKLMVNYKLIHRNLNPSNILIKDINDENITLKLGGFSNCTFSDSINNTTSNSPYDAPEIVNNHIANLKSDLWSIGIILYELLFQNNNPTFNSYGEISNTINDQDLNNLINRLLKKNPKDRISWDDYFSHPFFNQENNAKNPFTRSQSSPLSAMEINLLKMEIDDNKVKMNKILNENKSLKEKIKNTEIENNIYKKKLSNYSNVFSPNNTMKDFNKLKLENNSLNERIDTISSEYLRTKDDYERKLHEKDIIYRKLNGENKELDNIVKGINLKYSKCKNLLEKYVRKYGKID